MGTTIIIMRAFVAISTLFSCAAAQYAYAGLPYAAAPAAAPYAAPYAAAYAPYVPSSQFQAQDEFGNLNYGYANLNSAKQETGNTYAGVTGGYSYVDANGQLQKVEYIADGAGFRVADSRLPVFNPDLPVAPVYTGVAPTFNPEPLVAPVYTGVAPASVVDTPEVAEAKAAHAAALVAAAAAAADRKKREADPAILGGATTVLSAPTPLIHNAPVLHHAAYAGLGYAGLGYAGLGHAGLGYAGLGHAGLGYAGLGQAGLAYAGLGHAGLAHAGLGHAGLGYAGVGYAGLGLGGLGVYGRKKRDADAGLLLANGGANALPIVTIPALATAGYAPGASGALGGQAPVAAVAAAPAAFAPVVAAALPAAVGLGYGG